jgi:hypothetical protein
MTNDLALLSFIVDFRPMMVMDCFSTKYIDVRTISIATSLSEKSMVCPRKWLRAVGKVVETYKSGAKKAFFGETSAVVYDKRTLAFRMIEKVSRNGLADVENRN